MGWSVTAEWPPIYGNRILHLHVNDNIGLKAEVARGAVQVGGAAGGLRFPWEHQLLARWQEGRMVSTLSSEA